MKKINIGWLQIWKHTNYIFNVGFALTFPEINPATATGHVFLAPLKYGQWNKSSWTFNLNMDLQSGKSV